MTTSLSDEVSVAQTIEDAEATLHVLDEKGWGQGQWCRKYDTEGDPEREFCLGGAMVMAIDPEYVAKVKTASPNYLTGMARARFNALAVAMGLVPHFGTGDHIPDFVVRYNDDVAKVVEDVKAKLNEAIVRLTAQATAEVSDDGASV